MQTASPFIKMTQGCNSWSGKVTSLILPQMVLDLLNKFELKRNQFEQGQNQENKI